MTPTNDVTLSIDQTLKVKSVHNLEYLSTLMEPEVENEPPVSMQAAQDKVISNLDKVISKEPLLADVKDIYQLDIGELNGFSLIDTVCQNPTFSAGNDDAEADPLQIPDDYTEPTEGTMKNMDSLLRENRFCEDAIAPEKLFDQLISPLKDATE